MIHMAPSYTENSNNAVKVKKHDSSKVQLGYLGNMVVLRFNSDGITKSSGFIKLRQLETQSKELYGFTMVTNYCMADSLLQYGL